MSEPRAAIAPAPDADREVASLVEALSAVLQRLRPDGLGGWHVVFTSRPLATLVGLDDPTDCARLQHSLSPQDNVTLLSCQNEAQAKGKATCEVEIDLPGLPSRTLRCVMRLNPRSAETPELIAIWTDVTEERIRRAHLTQADRLSTLGEMAVGLAHELNQPLSAIIVLADLVSLLVERGDTPAAEIIGKVERIAAMAERAGKIIKNLRNFARHSASSNGPVCLSDAIDNTRAMVGRLIEADGIRIEVALPPDLPAVHGDMTQIEQVLVNLLMNARDALLAAARNPACIAITATRDADSISLHIADNAGGIDPALQERLFEPFFTTQGNASGTGLGLSIARSAMNAMNGAITVRNDTEGAVFTLRFRQADTPQAPA